VRLHCPLVEGSKALYAYGFFAEGLVIEGPSAQSNMIGPMAAQMA